MGSRPTFFTSFVCDYLAKHVEARDLVKLKEDEGRFFLYFNNIDKISLIYCDFKQQFEDKELKRDAKNRRDNLKNTLALSEKDGSLKKVASVKDHERGTDKLKYEVMNSELRHSLRSNFHAIQKNRRMTHENFGGSHTVLSSDLSSDAGGMSQPGVPLFDQTHRDFHTSHAETSSDTGLGMTQSDDQFHNQTHENHREGRESRDVLSSELSSDTGDVSQIDSDRFVNETILGDVDVEKMTEDITKKLDDSSLNDQMNISTSEEETSQRPQPLLTAVGEKIPELKIVPNYDSIEGGGQFIARANQDLPEGTYTLKFADYGTCKAWGSGSKHLDGCDNIPAARRRGTHSITVQVFDVRGKSIGGIPFEYRDNNVNRYKNKLAKNSKSLSGSNPDNEPHQRKQKSSSNSMQYPGPNKRSKSDPVDMPMVMYFCDEMAKGGDEDFFSALEKLGILAEVLANRSEYYKDFAITAKEHGYNELAEMLAVSPRELPCDGDMETLTIGKLLDAVQQERSLENFDPVISDSDDDSNSCSSGYNGDCDSEDLNSEEESLNDVIIQEAESPSDGDCTNGSLKENEDKTDSVLGNWNSHYDDVDVEKEHIFEDEDNGEKTSLVERSLNPNQEETVAGVHNKTTGSSCCPTCTEGCFNTKVETFREIKRTLFKKKIMQKITSALCAVLNSNGGQVVIPVEGFPVSQMSSVKIYFKEDKDNIVIFIEKIDNSLETTNYHLYLPSETQVVQMSSLESLVVPEPVQLGSHCGIGESKMVQLKLLKAGLSKRTTLADRMTGKGNTFSCYVSAFATYNGGHIYYGIRDDGVVEGELVTNENDKNDILTKKVEKVINTMIWPQQIGQPKRENSGKIDVQWKERCEARARSLWQECGYFRKKRKLSVRHLNFSDSNLKDPNVMLQSFAIQMSDFEAKLVNQFSSECVNPWLDVQLLIDHGNPLRAIRLLAKEILRVQSRAMDYYEEAIDVELLCSAAVETPISCSRRSAAKQTIQPVSHSVVSGQDPGRVEGIQVDREAGLAEENQTNHNENGRNEETNSKNDVIIHEPESVADSLADGQCCTNGILKGNGDKPDAAVLGSCNSQYDGNLNEKKTSANVPESVTINVEKEEHIFEDEDNVEKTSLVERSLNPNQEETGAGVDNKTTDYGLSSHLTKPENKGKIDVQWKERCEESMEKLEELTGIPDSRKSSFTEAMDDYEKAIDVELLCSAAVETLIFCIRHSAEMEYSGLNDKNDVIIHEPGSVADSLADWPLSMLDLWWDIKYRRESRLLDAVESGRFQEVKRSIQSGADVNKRSLFGEAVLHSAAEHGSLEIVKYLVEHHADVNAKDHFGRTALHYAAERGSLEIVKYLVEHRADVNEKRLFDKTALHYVAERGSLETVKYLVEHGADVNAKCWLDNKTALHSAAKHGSLEIVIYLVEHHADINEKCSLGKTALHYSVQHGSLGIVKCLVEHRADINAKHWLSNKTALHSAAEQGSLEIVKYLIQCGANANAECSFGITGLHSAAKRGSLETVKHFVESGADVNEKDRSKKTALHYAAERDSLKIVKYLFKQGAVVNAKDSSKKTALFFAAEHGSLKTVKYLVEHGADINAKDWSKKTALHYATEWGSSEIVENLIEYDAYLKKQDEKNKRALHYAATKLLLMKLDVNVQNVKDSIRRSDDTKILDLELKKSIKPGQKIQILKAMDNEKLTKVGLLRLALKYFAPDEYLSIRTGSVRRSVCIGIMEDGSEVAVTLRMMAQTESDGARMIKEILNDLEFLHGQGILHRDLKPLHVLVDVVGHMKLADVGCSHVLNRVGSPLTFSAPR